MEVEMGPRFFIDKINLGIFKISVIKKGQACCKSRCECVWKRKKS